MRHLRPAVDEATADLIAVAADGPGEIKPKEDQIRAAMYHYYRTQGFCVHVEAAHPNQYTECDLRVAGHNGNPERWIELKTLWSATNWTNKPGQQIAGLRQDAMKLTNHVPDGAARYLVAFCFCDRTNTGPQLSLRGLLRNQPWQPLFIIPNVEFAWRDSAISHLDVYAWQV